MEVFFKEPSHNYYADKDFVELVVSNLEYN